MNNRILLVPLFMVALVAPSYVFSFEGYQAYQARQAMSNIMWYILNYPSRLEMRRNMPESKDEYLKRVEVGLEHLDTHLQKTVKDDYDWSVTGPIIKDLNWEISAKWKQGWWDRNPGWGDLICVSSIITVLGILIKILPDPAAGAPLAVNDGALPPPPPYAGPPQRLGDN